MNIISHTSTGERSIKIPINTVNPNITFNGSNYNDISALLDNPIQLKDTSQEFLISISNFQIPISWPIISSYQGNNILEYILNGTTYTYTIPDGSYSAND